MSENIVAGNTAAAVPRIVIVAKSFPALSETFVMDQIDALQSRGFNVRIVAEHRNDSGLIQEKGRRLGAEAVYAGEQMGSAKLLPSSLRRRLYDRWLQRRIYARLLCDADLVICHFGPVGATVAKALADNSRPRLWTIFHGFDLSAFLRREPPEVYAQLFERGDRFLGISRLWMAKLEEIGCPPQRIGLLRMGIDVDLIPFTDRKFDASRGIRLLSVGRLVEKKGMEFAVRAVADLLRLRPTLKCTYEIIGEGPLRNSLEKLIRELGLEQQVQLVGALPREAVQKKLLDSDIFLLPSITAQSGDMEGIPVALMEAMASGAAVVSTFHSGIPELVEDGVSGLLAPERDFATLARNLCLLIDQPDLRSSMAVSARKKVEEEFSQKTISDCLAADIRAALAN